MKTKLTLLTALFALLIASCKDEETPAPQPDVRQPSEYFVQVNPTEESQAGFVPIFQYATDSAYRHGGGTATAYPYPKVPVYGFKDSIELRILSGISTTYALNIYFKDSLLVTDTFYQNQTRPILIKWRL
jgi:hypothetical protein